MSKKRKRSSRYNRTNLIIASVLLLLAVLGGGVFLGVLLSEADVASHEATVAAGVDRTLTAVARLNPSSTPLPLPTDTPTITPVPSATPIVPGLTPDTVRSLDIPDPADLAWSPRGRWLAVTGTDSGLWLWHTATGDLEHTLSPESRVQHPAWSGEGRLLAGMTNNQMTVWLVERGDIHQTFTVPEDETLLDIALAAARYEAVLLTDQAIYRYSLDGGAQLARTPVDGAILLAGNYTDDSLIFTTTQIVSSLSLDNDPVQQQNILQLVDPDLRITALDVAPDGQTLAIAAGTEIRIKPLAGDVFSERVPGRATISDLAWSPDSALLAVADINGMIHLWQPGEARPGRTLEHDQPLQKIAWSPDARALALIDTTGIVIRGLPD